MWLDLFIGRFDILSHSVWHTISNYHEELINTKVKTSQLLIARENASDQAVMDFTF